MCAFVIHTPEQSEKEYKPSKAIMQESFSRKLYLHCHSSRSSLQHSFHLALLSPCSRSPANTQDAH